MTAENATARTGSGPVAKAAQASAAVEGKATAPPGRLPSEAWAQARNVMRDPAFPTVTARAQALVMILVEYADGDAKCWPSVATLAKRLGIAESSKGVPVQRALTALEDAGMIRFPKGRSGGRKPSVIQIVAALPAEANPVENDGVRQPRRKRRATPVQNDGPPPSKTTDEPNYREPKKINEPKPSLTRGARERGHGSVPDPPHSDRGERLLDALCEAIEREPSTASERRAWLEFAGELVDVGATPQHVLDAADAYRDRWPGAALTPKALAAQWSLLVKEAEELAWYRSYLRTEDDEGDGA